MEGRDCVTRTALKLLERSRVRAGVQKTFRLSLARESEEAKAKRVVLRINKAKENRRRWFLF